MELCVQSLLPKNWLGNLSEIKTVKFRSDENQAFGAETLIQSHLQRGDLLNYNDGAPVLRGVILSTSESKYGIITNRGF